MDKFESMIGKIENAQVIETRIVKISGTQIDSKLDGSVKIHHRNLQFLATEM